MPTHRWGDFTPSGHLGRILDDKTPQLGGTLDGNGFNFNGAVGFEAQAGEALTHGDAVYVSGVSGNKPVVMKADADDAAKMPAFGIAENDANLNANVEVITFGTVYNIDTSGWQIGDELYISTTPGVLTSTPPTGATAKLQNIGKVIRSHASAGSIKVGGAGRTNAVPNLDDGTVFIGDSNNQAEQRALVLADISDYTAPTETDPVYTASSWYTTTNNSSNWDTAYSWGDHASAGYQTSTTWTANSILSSRATAAPDTAGDSAGINAHYMTSAAVNKPTGTDHSLLTLSYSAAWQTQIAADWRNGGQLYIRGQNNGTWSAWANVWDSTDFSSANISNWQTAYGWGDHASAGYATSFDSLSAKDSGTGTYRTTGYLQSGTSGSGLVSLTTNDGGGNANVTFNHAGNAPDHAGYNTGRITVNVDSTSGAAMDLRINNAGLSPATELQIVPGRAIATNRLDLTDANLQLTQDGGYFEVQTPSGYTRIGSGNSSWSHFYTDRAAFYFGAGVQVDGYGLRGYDASTDCRFPIYYDLNDTAYYCDPAGTSRLNVSYNNNTSHLAGNGYGVKFWNTDSYKIYMSSISDSTWGGDVANSNSSDYAMYFRMTSGTNRGFIFRNNTTNVAKIDGAGRATFSGLSSTGQYFDFTYNSTGAGGIRMYDSGNVRQVTFYGDGAGGGGILDNDAHWGYRQRTGTSATEIRCNNNNELLVYTSYVRAAGSMRSPIFYDFNNTTYYAHLDDTSTSIRCAGNIIAYYSDERLKNVEGNIENALDKVCSLNGFYYRANEKAQKLGYKDDLQVGLSAQEVQKVLPEVIKDAPADSNYMTLDYAKTVPLLVEAIKELKEEIEELKAG